MYEGLGFDLYFNLDGRINTLNAMIEILNRPSTSCHGDSVEILISPLELRVRTRTTGCGHRFSGPTIPRTGAQKSS